MATVVAGDFNDDPRPNVNEWLRRLTAIVSGGSSEEFLEKLEQLLEMPPQGIPLAGFTPMQIAKMEGVEPATIREWIRNGKLRAVPDRNRKAGRHPRLVILDEDYRKFKRGGH